MEVTTKSEQGQSVGVNTPTKTILAMTSLVQLSQMLTVDARSPGETTITMDRPYYATVRLPPPLHHREAETCIVGVTLAVTQ